MTPRVLRSERGIEVSLETPVVMAVVNVTPDSFSDGGKLQSVAHAVDHGLRLVEEGAHILDIGGESTRPGAPPVDLETELARVVPVVEGLCRAGISVPISVDTQKPEVAQAAIEAGADIINDVSALKAPGMASVAANTGSIVILMHMRGIPETMQAAPIHYEDTIREVKQHLQNRIDYATAAGIQRDRIITDPGIGFGKELRHNLTLTKHLAEFQALGCPILFGPSRKRFLGEITGRQVDDRDRATAAVCALAVLAGADIFRVHDVAAVTDALAVAHAVRSAS